MKSSNRCAQPRHALLVLLPLLFLGCLPPVIIPMETVRYDSNRNGRGRLLFVYLPGNGDPATAVRTKGLLGALREEGLAADIIAVNAHLGYYLNGTFVKRLKDDVIDPARAAGYERIWLIGNSLGGYGSLTYAREYPDDIAGAVILGPFLGSKKIIGEIKREGGIDAWTPSEAPEKREEVWDEHLWSWMKECRDSGWSEKEARCPGIYLGYGRSDRFSEGQTLLARLLPPEQVIVIDGGHDWATWRTLWVRFLHDRIFQ